MFAKYRGLLKVPCPVISGAQEKLKTDEQRCTWGGGMENCSVQKLNRRSLSRLLGVYKHNGLVSVYIVLRTLFRTNPQKGDLRYQNQQSF